MTLVAASTPSLSFFSSSLLVTSPHHSPKCLPCPPRSSSNSISLQTCSDLTATLHVHSFSDNQTSTGALCLKSAPPPTTRAVVHRAIIPNCQNARRSTASTLTVPRSPAATRSPTSKKDLPRAPGIRAHPLRPGGGVIFGPKPKDWSIKINCKEKRLSISTAIARTAAFKEDFEKGPKMKEFIAAMKRWGLDPKEKTMIFMTKVSDNVMKSCRNIRTLKMLTPRTLNLFDILDSKKLVFTKSSVEYLNAMYGKDAEYEYEAEGEEELEGNIFFI